MGIIDVVERRFSGPDELEGFIQTLESPWYGVECHAMAYDDPDNLWRFSTSRRRLIQVLWPGIKIVFSDSRYWKDWIKEDIAEGRGKPCETFSQWYPGDWIVENYWYDDSDCGEWSGNFKFS